MDIDSRIFIDNRKIIVLKHDVQRNILRIDGHLFSFENNGKLIPISDFVSF